MDPVYDPRTGKMVDPQTGLPVGDRAPGHVEPDRVSTLDQILNGTGIPERVDAAHKLFNPVSALQEAGQASEQMIAPGKEPLERVASLGQMLTGMAGTVAPMWASSKGAVPTTQAIVDALTGINVGDPGAFLADELGGIKAPGYGQGITAYQGSPHNFAAERLVRYPDGRTEYIVGNPDVLPDIPQGASVVKDYPLGRMRMDKIGTGEGAQAYGHGMYAAENEGVARGYRDALSQGRPTISGTAADLTDPEHGAAFFVQQHGGDRSAAIAEMERMFRDGEIRPHEATLADGVLRRLKSDAPLPNVVEQSVPGSVYEVRINANPDDFLDWDKPLSEQSSKVQRALGNLGIKYDADGMRAYDDALLDALENDASRSLPKQPINPTGADIVQYHLDKYSHRGRLLEEDIPGIKYLDAGSRGAGDGSRNYVVFDENLIEIVKKYGVAGAAAMLGMTAADVEQAMAGSQTMGNLTGPTKNRKAVETALMGAQ